MEMQSMRYDKKIKKIIEKISEISKEYLDFVNDMNECATTDRMIENIIAKSKELDHYYKANFENIVETKKNKDDMEL